MQKSRANLILQPLQQAIEYVNTILPNRNEYREINPKIDDIPLQATLFNPPPKSKPYTTKEKSLAILFNAKQVIATLKTTTNLQFSQKVYPTLVERKYKHMSTSSTHVPNMRTTSKSFAIFQAPYTY